jgi:GDP-L-fucose synthase
MPANLYGPKDNFHPEYSHVIPGLMRRIHDARMTDQPKVTVWGTGKPTRDFLFSQDLAEGLLFLMQNYDGLEHINIGPSRETSIAELAQTMAKIVGYTGELEFDTSKPDGTPRRYLDTSKINALGWSARTSLEDGLVKTYKWYQENIANS